MTEQLKSNLSGAFALTLIFKTLEYAGIVFMWFYWSIFWLVISGVAVLVFSALGIIRALELGGAFLNIFKTK